MQNNSLMLPRTVVDQIYKQPAACARRLPFKAGFVIYTLRTQNKQEKLDCLVNDKEWRILQVVFLFVINFTEFLVRDNAQTCTREATIKVHVNKIRMPPSVVWKYYVKLGYEFISFQSEWNEQGIQCRINNVWCDRLMLLDHVALFWFSSEFLH